MTSKELNEILNKTRRTPNISLTPEQVEELVKKLEILEILKDKEVDVIYFKTLIPFHKGEDLMIFYNLKRWKGNLTLEETIKLNEWWLDGK